ncbi:MAG: hypothetical protein FWG32_01570 [Oscillospiraceae bacterium]|nr:hypothetical protein [Oscillospiraceae bacterium]
MTGCPQYYKRRFEYTGPENGGPALKQITVFIGNSGSGKTELAINFALSYAERGSTQLIDLDLLNPYFRLSERRETVQNAGIDLVAPNNASGNVESMSLSPRVNSAFDFKRDNVIFDVGGDPAGTMAIGRYRRKFEEFTGRLEVLYTVNIRRPMTDTREKIISLMTRLQEVSGLGFTGLVNNANLAGETTPVDLFEGYEILRRVSEETGVLTAYTTGCRQVLEEFLKREPDKRFVGMPKEIKIYMHRDWHNFTETLKGSKKTNGQDNC